MLFYGIQMGAPKDPVKRTEWIEKISKFHIGKKPWNKGLTKNNNRTLLMMSNSSKGKKQNKKFKKSVSIAQRKRYETVFKNTINNNTNKLKKLINDPIINGILLSDGYISKRKGNGNGNSRFKLDQCELHPDFVMKIQKCLESYGFITKVKHVERFDKRTNKVYKSINLSTKLHPMLSLLKNIWYPKGKKIVPKMIKLSPQLLCTWFEGDGSSRILKNSRHAKQVVIQLSTEAFDYNSMLILITLMRDFGIMSSINKENRILIWRNESVVKFMDLIKPLISESFNYKIKYPTYKTATEFRDNKKICHLQD